MLLRSECTLNGRRIAPVKAAQGVSVAGSRQPNFAPTWLGFNFGPSLSEVGIPSVVNDRQAISEQTLQVGSHQLQSCALEHFY